MTTEPKEFNFLPDDFRDRNVRRRLTAAAVAILAIFAIATVTALYVAERSLHHVKRRNAEVTWAFDRAMLRGEQAMALRDDQERLAERARRIAALASGIPSSRILTELTGALPQATSLTSLSVQSIPHPQTTSIAPTAFDQKKAALESKRRAGAESLPEVVPTDVIIKLSGIADTNVAVSQFCDNLSRSPIFQDVHLLVSEICAESGNAKAITRRFQIETMLNPSADVNRTAADSSTPSIVSEDVGGAGAPVRSSQIEAAEDGRAPSDRSKERP